MPEEQIKTAENEIKLENADSPEVKTQETEATQYNIVTEKLPCVLTDEEKAAMGDKLAEQTQEMLDLETEKKALAVIFNNQIKEKKGLIKEMSAQITSGAQERHVKCDEVPEWEKDRIRVIRQDTGELVREREILPEEKQETMFNKEVSEGPSDDLPFNTDEEQVEVAAEQKFQQWDDSDGVMTVR